MGITTQMDHALTPDKAYRTDNDEVINDCIAKILDADKLRKELTIQNTELVYKMIQEDDLVNIIYSSNFYEGVLGIIAQKIMKKTGKITGIFNVDSENNARGSFRTVGEYNILSMLDENKDLLDKFGGHEKACGVNMRASKIKELKERLSNMVKADLPISKEVEVSLILNHTLVNSDFFLELQKYELEENGTIDVYTVAQKNKWLLKNAEPDEPRASGYILSDFREGRLGKIILDELNDKQTV